MGNDPIIDSLDRYYPGQPSRQPLFVSEGSPEHKLRTIRGSDYLSFALNTLATDDDNIVVFGSSLSPPDAHIVQAINKTSTTSKNVAISARPAAPLCRACPGPGAWCRAGLARWPGGPAGLPRQGDRALVKGSSRAGGL